MVPIFDSFRPYLEQAFDAAVDGELYVFPTLRLNTNPGTSAKKIVIKAKQELWKNFFNSIRASAETDLMDEFGLRRACQWAGNSPATAMKNYALTRNTDFKDEGKSVRKSDAKSDAINARDAKSDAARDSTRENGGSGTPTKKALSSMLRADSANSVDDIGLEPTTSTMSTWRSSQLS